MPLLTLVGYAAKLAIYLFRQYFLLWYFIIQPSEAFYGKLKTAELHLAIALSNIKTRYYMKSSLGINH